jgi:hypothetical protein
LLPSGRFLPGVSSGIMSLIGGWQPEFSVRAVLESHHEVVSSLPWVLFSSMDSERAVASMPWVLSRVTEEAEWALSLEPLVLSGRGATDSLRLFRQGCETYGSAVVYQGTAIDLGYQEQFWPILPAGPSSVLVMTKVALRNTRHHQKGFWSVVNLRTGQLSTTRIPWEHGAWEHVSRPLLISPAKAPSCSGIMWSWP